ncbi:MAG: TetR/AcrR family transcriptional regulator [Firmicutes bacterium]|nr:TetR/AcrR family transcriptional regulator [Bacillota bacterium]
MDAEKQKQILDAVIKEFAQHGYSNASTNRMVQEAGISKGMLFYYFKNKEELFRYALEYSIDYIAKEYVSKLDFSEPDFIARLTQITEAKLRAYLQNPLPFAFLANILQTNRDVKEMFPDLYRQLEEMSSRKLKEMFMNVDTTLFRQDVAPRHIFNLIRWSVDGYSQELLAYLEGKSLLDLDWGHHFAEYYEFLNVLKRVFYEEVDHGSYQGT